MNMAFKAVERLTPFGFFTCSKYELMTFGINSVLRKFCASARFYGEGVMKWRE